MVLILLFQQNKCKIDARCLFSVENEMEEEMAEPNAQPQLYQF